LTSTVEVAGARRFPARARVALAWPDPTAVMAVCVVLIELCWLGAVGYGIWLLV
jgi:hypothetical protein